MTETHLSSRSFTDLDLPTPLLQGASDSGFEFCTPIQAEALPIALAGQDVAGQAKTGTGKTAAFLFALFAYLLRHPAPADRTPRQPLGLVLAPTRELAIQIHKDAQVLGRHTQYKLGLIYGGTGYETQRRTLEDGVDILIGTPGRLIDYFKQQLFDLSLLQVVVLDEADRMFDLGFIRDIRYLFRRMPSPEQRLNMLFSATLSLRVNELAYEHMNNPQVVKIESEHLTVDQVTEKVYFPSNEEKIPLLLHVLTQVGAVRTLVFVNTKHGAENVEAWLRGNDYVTGVLSGNVPQRKREQLLQDFKSGEVPVLVATDVAARGLHIPEVSHVVNYDLPQDAEDYVHRVGRTARAGASGDAVSFACETYAFSLEDIEQYIGHKIPVDKIDHEALVQPKPPVRPKRRSRSAPNKKRPAQGKRTRSSKAGGHRHVKTAHRDVGSTKSMEGERRSKQNKKPRTTEDTRKQANAKPAADKTIKTKPKDSKKPAKIRRGGKEKPAVG
jgi:ATP-dependent RNA helicase RhlB